MDLSRSLTLALPGRTFRLFGQYWVPLIFWYLLGEGLHNLFAEVAARVNFYNAIAGYSILAFAILCRLTCYVLMFLSVQGGLPTVWRLRGTGPRTNRELLTSVGLAIMPFLLVWSAYGLFQDDLRQLQYRTWQFHAHEGGGGPPPVEFVYPFAIAAVIAWVLVKVCEAVTRRTKSPVTGTLAAVFEANWMFFSIFGITELLKNGREWLGNTVVVGELGELKDFVADVIPVLPIRVGDAVNVVSFDFGWLGNYTGALSEGLVLPLAWLAIAGCCYGREMEDLREVIGGKHLAKFDDRWQRAPGIVKRWGHKFPPDPIKEKYYPPFHAIRVMLANGLPGFLVFCLLYSLLTLGGSVFQQAYVAVIGPHSPAFFWGGGVDSLTSQITNTFIEPLKICLLAAAFETGMAAFMARSEGTGETPYSRKESAGAAASPAP